MSFEENLEAARSAADFGDYEKARRYLWSAELQAEREQLTEVAALRKSIEREIERRKRRTR